ncbi:flavodoxin domain-containing protein [Cellulomonas sp. KRMCY2]|uniref:flavodoxin domain-containing protein n=1 Tax=Cellulomonas sp. KRMCY2 TaxID=1304865 RepID=UPI0004A4448B|nr:flavodoxin domain-containing protein [Cellulomonas sp. KRMCY2]
MSVLVVHGSKRGGTQGLAESIGQVLSGVGHDVRVEPAADVRGLDGVTAVIVAGGLYASRWHKDARRFVRRHRRELAVLPVWLVASGPLDDSADAGTLPPVAQVSAVGTSIGARGEVTFGGRLTPDARGFPASAMAKTQAGDWRNEERIRQWALQVHSELAA